MKRYLAIFGFVFIGVIAGLLVRGIPIVLQVQAGGGIQADQNGDVNGDARLDMSDAVYLLLHIFRDGPQPVAFAQGFPDNAEQLLEEIANPCKERSDRFIKNGDGTVTDTCTKLMWLVSEPRVSRNWDSAKDYCEGRIFAGHDNWRLPTPSELKTIYNRDFLGGFYPEITSRFNELWTVEETYSDNLGAWYFIPNSHSETVISNGVFRSQYLFRHTSKTASKPALPIRDMSPDE